VCSSLKKGLWSLIRLTSFPNTCFSTCLVLIRNLARCRLCVHTLRFETAKWNQSNSPTCSLCDADDVQDEQHVLFHCAIPHMISVRRKYASLFPPTGAHDVSIFINLVNLCRVSAREVAWESLGRPVWSVKETTLGAHIPTRGFAKKYHNVFEKERGQAIFGCNKHSFNNQQ
jgi:hypothetical protein